MNAAVSITALVVSEAGLDKVGPDRHRLRRVSDREGLLIGVVAARSVRNHQERAWGGRLGRG